MPERYTLAIDETSSTQSGPLGPLGSLRAQLREGPAIPEQLGRFRVRRILGEGAMGVVYEAVDAELGRPVALKLVRPALSSPARQRRLLREAQSLARLAHPNVLVVYDVGSVEGSMFIAMEYVEGQNLGEWLRAEDRDWTEVVEVFVQAGAGVAAAHEAGLVHRDFKPANVLIGVEGRVRVADFGLARLSLELPTASGESATSAEATAGSGTSLSHTGTLVGTPAYMAPELLEGGQADALSDQYSFCVALYEALHGQRPFVGRDVDSLLDAIRSGPPLNATTSRRVPAWVDALVVRGLGPRRDRWPSIAALVAALDVESRQRRRRIVRAVGAAGLVFTGLGATALAWRPPPSDPCPADDALAATWNPSSRAEVRAQLSRQSSPDAAWVATTVVDELDAYAQRWQAAGVDACEATRVHGQLSEQALDRRTRCLARARTEFEALVRVLELADSEVEEGSATRALFAVDELPSLARCADPNYADATLEPPEDPLVAQEVERLETELAAVSALERTGRFAEAQARVDALEREAQALAYRPLLAAIGLAQGQILDDLGDAKAAADRFEQAFLDAEASGASALAQAATLRLVHVYGHGLDQQDAAERWARIAGAKIDFNRDEDARVRLAINRGEIYEAAGKSARALESYELAERLHRRSAEPPALRGAEIADDIGLVLVDLGRYDEAQASLEQALEVWRAQLGPAHPLVARAFNSLGALHARTARYAEAARSFESALEIWIRTKGPDSDDVAAVHSNLGVVYRRLEQPDQARAHLERALDIRDRGQGPDPGLASTLGNLGNLERREGNYEAARAAYVRALEIREQLFGPDEVRLATMLQGVGDCELALGRPAEALAPLERALALREAHYPPGHLFTAGLRSVLVETLIELGRVADARVELERELELIDDRPPEEARRCRIARVHAELLWAEGRRRAAHGVIERGLADCRAHNAEDPEAAGALERWRAAHPI